MTEIVGAIGGVLPLSYFRRILGFTSHAITDWPALMTDRNISATSVLLNVLATLGFIFVAKTPPHSTNEILGIAAAGLGVSGTVLVAIAFKREWLRVLSATLIIILVIAVRAAL